MELINCFDNPVLQFQEIELFILEIIEGRGFLAKHHRLDIEIAEYIELPPCKIGCQVAAIFM